MAFLSSLPYFFFLFNNLKKKIREKQAATPAVVKTKPMEKQGAFMEFDRGAMECFCSKINDLAEKDTVIHGFFVLCVFRDG